MTISLLSLALLCPVLLLLLLVFQQFPMLSEAILVCTMNKTAKDKTTASIWASSGSSLTVPYI
jgi:hypothetical protein